MVGLSPGADPIKLFFFANEVFFPLFSAKLGHFIVFFSLKQTFKLNSKIQKTMKKKFYRIESRIPAMEAGVDAERVEFVYIVSPKRPRILNFFYFEKMLAVSSNVFDAERERLR